MKGKKIILGVSGSIAAYKSALLIRLLVKAGAEVQVIMTGSAKDFITPLTLSTLSKRPVLSDYFDPASGTWHNHVELGLWADALILQIHLQKWQMVFVITSYSLCIYRHVALSSLHLQWTWTC